MRDGCAGPLVVLLFQVCDHARCEEEACTHKHLHAESQEEGPCRIICVQCATGETPGQVGNDEEYATVTCMVREAEDTWIAKGRDLGTVVSVLQGYDVQVCVKSYDCASDHCRVELGQADADGKTDLSCLSKG